MSSRGRHAAAEFTKGWACLHGQETLQQPMKIPLGSLKPRAFYVLYPLCCPRRFVYPCHSPADAVPVLSPPPVSPPAALVSQWVSTAQRYLLGVPDVLGRSLAGVGLLCAWSAEPQ